MREKTYVAQFSKVPYEQFAKDMMDLVEKNTDSSGFVNFTDEIKQDQSFLHKTYDDIHIPTRSTRGSAGYDFYLPEKLVMQKGKIYIVPTGIRCYMDDGFSLDIYPRSGLGIKHNVRLVNTVGIVDSDYFTSSNFGHIMIALIYEGYIGSPEFLDLEKGDRIAQGIIHQVFYASNHVETEFKVRDGGFGSTGR